jgi:ABC-type sugar transport systems, permease components
MRRKIFGHEARWAYLFIAPLMLGTIVFSIWPIVQSMYISLTKWDGFSMAEFVGFDNYIHAFYDSQMWRELFNTCYLAAGTIPTTIILSLLVACLLNSKIKGLAAYRTIYFLPNVTMVVAVAIVWRWIMNSKYGIATELYHQLGIQPVDWLGDPRMVLPAIIFVTVWGGIGYNAIILLSGLQGIPTYIYEAAEVDGASEFVKFFKITLPMISPTMFFVLIMLIINSFKSFDLIFMFAGATNPQGPILDSVRTMVYGIYEKGFLFYNMGYASTEAVILFVIILAITIIQLQVQKRWVNYE